MDKKIALKAERLGQNIKSRMNKDFFRNMYLAAFGTVSQDSDSLYRVNKSVCPKWTLGKVIPFVTSIMTAPFCPFSVILNFSFFLIHNEPTTIDWTRIFGLKTHFITFIISCCQQNVKFLRVQRSNFKH